jgi:hypothetical protein
MPKNVERKTEATADDSAKKIREEKIDLKTDCDEIEGQNSTVQINFATCMKCIEGGRGQPKKSKKYKTFTSIIEHTVNFGRDFRARKSTPDPYIEVEVGYKKGKDVLRNGRNSQF